MKKKKRVESIKKKSNKRILNRRRWKAMMLIVRKENTIMYNIWDNFKMYFEVDNDDKMLNADAVNINIQNLKSKENKN